MPAGPTDVAQFLLRTAIAMTVDGKAVQSGRVQPTALTWAQRLIRSTYAMKDLKGKRTALDVL